MHARLQRSAAGMLCGTHDSCLHSWGLAPKWLSHLPPVPSLAGSKHRWQTCTCSKLVHCSLRGIGKPTQWISVAQHCATKSSTAQHSTAMQSTPQNFSSNRGMPQHMTAEHCSACQSQWQPLTAWCTAASKHYGVSDSHAAQAQQEQRGSSGKATSSKCC